MKPQTLTAELKKKAQVRRYSRRLRTLESHVYRLKERISSHIDQAFIPLYFCLYSFLEYKVSFPYDARRDDELTLKEGDLVVVFETADSGWWRGSAGTKHGWFPGSYVEVNVVLGISDFWKLNVT